jgi:peptide/nickel transport system substrate-binding protein
MGEKMMGNNDSSQVSPIRQMIIGLTLTLILTGCGGAPVTPPETVAPTQAATEAPTEAVPTRGQGGTLTLLYFQAPTMVNPHLSSGTKDLSASRITYEPLASFNKDAELIPFLAAEVPSLQNGQVAADGTSVTWKLKQDVKWADGEPFTADDVYVSIHHES